jgi:hypothetical protein
VETLSELVVPAIALVAFLALVALYSRKPERQKIAMRILEIILRPPGGPSGGGPS